MCNYSLNLIIDDLFFADSISREVTSIIGDSDQPTALTVHTLSSSNSPNLSLEVDLYLLRVRTRVAFKQKEYRKMLLDMWKKILEKEESEENCGDGNTLRSSLFFPSLSPPSSSPASFSYEEGDGKEKEMDSLSAQQYKGNLHFLLSNSQAIDEAISHYLQHFSVLFQSFS